MKDSKDFKLKYPVSDQITQDQINELQSANSLDTYRVRFGSGTERTLTRNALFHNQLQNEQNHQSVVSFEKYDENGNLPSQKARNAKKFSFIV